MFSLAHTEPGDFHRGRFSTTVTDNLGAITLTGERDVVWAVVSIKAKGVSIIDDWDGFGQSLTASGTAIFNRVALEKT